MIEPRSSEQAPSSTLLPFAPCDEREQDGHSTISSTCSYSTASSASKGWHDWVSRGPSTEWQLQVLHDGRRHYGHFQFALKLGPAVVSHNQCLHSSHVPWKLPFFLPAQLGLPDHQPLQHTVLGLSLNGSGTALSHYICHIHIPWI